MPTQLLAKIQRKTTPAISVLIYATCVTIITWLRLGPWSGSVVNLSYGVPLLICLWYPDRRLLWSMAGSFALVAAYKMFVVPPSWAVEQQFVVWGIQMVNMLVIGIVVHLVIELMARISAQKAEADLYNQELLAREEEISRQNEELQSQAEELAQQNEEIQQQAEELQVQTEELHASNEESNKRQAILQSLLNALHGDHDNDLPVHVCELLMSLLGDAAEAAVILEKEGDDMVVIAHAGPVGLPTERWSYKESFAAVVMSHDCTAYIPDLRLRPDLKGAQTIERKFRSVLATPLRLAGRPAGVVKVYSIHEHEWTKEQFQLIEWVSAQCSLLMDTRRLHAELQRINTHLDGLVAERTSELQELVNELEHFSYTITHDLRAPLRAIHGFASLLNEECAASLDAQNRDFLVRITTAAERMDRLITDALSYSRVVRHEMPMESVDLRRLLQGMIDSYPVFQQPNAYIEVAEDLPVVLGNEAGLTQCFSNLMGNAVKFVAPGQTPRVRITGTRHGNRVRIECADNGIGIPKELQSRVFVMFQRLSKDYEGTGIGLTLVKKVVERMGGAVGLESEAGQGCRFWIELDAPASNS